MGENVEELGSLSPANVGGGTRLKKKTGSRIKREQFAKKATIRSEKTDRQGGGALGLSRKHAKITQIGKEKGTFPTAWTQKSSTTTG